MVNESVRLSGVQFHLKDLSQELVDEWTKAFLDCPAVEASQGSILEASADAIVSPANSFGYMDGGLDLVYSQHFGWQVEGQIRAKILADYDGELPVGQAVVCGMEREHGPYFMICAPTMRVPMRLDGTVNAYLAFRAVLRAVRAHNRDSSKPIRSVLCPGLGTGEGRMPAARCARQMRFAYDVVALGNPLRKGGLGRAVENHIELLR
ncbi:MAG: macro domain-containing protein [Acidobacteriota bacterium]